MLVEVVLFLCAALAYLYYVVTKQFDFFKNLGVPYAEPSFPFGSKSFRAVDSLLINEVVNCFKIHMTII